VAVGYTVPETLVAATKTNAEILDMDDELGTLESGKLADIIVVNGKPDSNLKDLARIDIVVRDGWVVIEDGNVVIPRHVPKPEPDPQADRRNWH
jgi:imidazolonepropionase-like amidohydrolase